MDVTANRGYPYPECDPPLVKDTSDAPAQTLALAEAFDADVTVYDDRRHAVYDRKTGVMRLVVGVAIVSNGANILLPFDTSQYDSGGMVDLAADAFVVPSTGLYLYTVYASVTGAQQQMDVRLVVNGISQYAHVAESSMVAGTSQVNGTASLLLNAGDIVQFTISFAGTDTATGWAALTQIGPA